ncbi:acetyl-CoA synthetase-like protein [Lindgomyces ingoldianus]|uniref:Acetyl-CoA synthetase-like protein n=1 Tax=Lindgomyces ingoldianus TaxID=673940 RepID=A0ACB6RDF2_9PLEO|nr:acetyl-CoA synthetase-like protein [Lindgomyces ingoldianus]KAF2476547.1 acetyl-CoA synthetase-like protein [Lindgomyces ingoldianus]
MQTLPYVLPAAAASLAYLNGRLAISYDWALLSSYISAITSSIIHEYRDDINLFNILESHAHSSRASHPWIIHHGRSWTYAQAYEITKKYGNWLVSKGVQKDEVVAVDFMNSEVFVWVWFGLWSVGAKPAFINYNLTGKPLLHTIRTSSARLVLVDENGRAKFSEEVMKEHGFVAKPIDADVPKRRQVQYRFDNDPNMAPLVLRKHIRSTPTQKQQKGSKSEQQPRKLEILFFDQGLEDYIMSLESTRPPDSLRNAQKLHDMAMLIYTSGTTGLPKPAVMSWGKANLGAKFVANWVPLMKTDIMYTPMPLYHSSASVLGICSTLRAGSTIHISRKFSHKTFWPEVRSSGATIIHYVGETCRYLLAAPKSPLDKAHKVRAAFGNGLRPDVWEPFKERFGISTIYEFYAATESPSGIWNRSTNAFSAGAIGRNGTLATILMGPSLAIVRMDPDSEPPSPLRSPKSGLCQIAAYDEPGELLYKLDPSNPGRKFQGYFGNASATNSKILRDVKRKGDAYFRTGDLMRWDKEGRWWFVDRIGDTFRWKAENVSTAEVADVLGKHDTVEEANVYGVLVPKHDGRAGCAAVVLKSSTESKARAEKDRTPHPHPQTLKSLATHLKHSLPSFAVPLFLRITKNIHTTGTNKQQKHIFQSHGISVPKVEESGDVLFWLRGDTYEKFTVRDWERIEGGGVKL